MAREGREAGEGRGGPEIGAGTKAALLLFEK